MYKTMATIADFFIALGTPLMLKAFFTAIIIGILGGAIGVFVLLKGMVFLGEAIAHSAFAGAALGILLGVDPLITIVIFGLIAAIGVGYVNEKKVMKDEVIIGIVFTSFMALAILFIGLMPFYSTDVTSILFGDILLTSWENFIVLVFIAASVLLLIWAFKKELYFITFNSEMAEIAGIPVKFINYLFLVIIALTIDISLKAIGAILVFAMIVTPNDWFFCSFWHYFLCFWFVFLIHLELTFWFNHRRCSNINFCFFIYNLPKKKEIWIRTYSRRMRVLF